MNTVIGEKQLVEYKKYLILHERSAATVQKYLRDVRCFARFLKSRALGKEAVIEYKQILQKRYAAASVNAALASLNGFFAFLGRCELRVKSLRLQRKLYVSEERELTRAEYERLCRAAESAENERLSLILQTICGTGIRVSELCFITAEAASRGTATVCCKGKTRNVFIVNDLRKKLLRYAEKRGIKSGMLFVTRTGKPICRTTVWREMKKLCERARVNPKKVFPHNLRHLFARVFYGVERDIAKLADILGHSSINTTRIYIISTGAEHRRKMENMRLII